MVGFDAHFVMLSLRPSIPASVDNAKERVLLLLEELRLSNEKVVIPTPALTEFLVHAEEAGPRYLDEIQKSSKFKIASYGVRAAIDVAQVIAEAVTRKDKRDGTRDTLAKVNFDRQIAGTCKAEGCHTLYTDDHTLKNFARRLGLRVVTLADLPTPAPPPEPPKPPLIEEIERAEKEDAKGQEHKAGS
jgi:predicted nucleic acid-binding protein